MNQGPYAPYPQYPQQPQGGYPPHPGGQPQGYPPQQYGQGYPPQQYQRPPDDESHLNILSICHFCYAGLVAIVGLVFSVYLVIGIVIAGAAVSSAGSSAAGPEAAMGGIFIVIGGVAMLFTFGKASLLVWSGISMRKRRRATLSFVVACLSCINIPLGTTLGVFTMIVLNRPSVKALYAYSEQQAV